MQAFATDALIDEYVAWRDAEAEVWAAYERWDPRDFATRSLVFTGYLAALDREEHAARCYEQQVDRIASLLGLRHEPRGLTPGS